MITAQGQIVDACSLCTECIPFDQAVTACTFAVVAGVVLTMLAYRIGVWLRK